MSKLAKKETAALSTEVLESWGTDNIDAQDILIPRVLLMQGLSQHVADDKAQMGDIVLSTTGEKVGGKDKPMQFIPICHSKAWVLSEKVGQKYEFRGTEAITAANADLPLEFQAQGTMWRRDRCLNFYVILPAHVEREKLAIEKAAKGELPDPNDALLPCVLSFRRTSYGTGKELVTHFSKCAHFKLPPAVSTFNLTSEKQSNDQGTFYIFKISSAGKSDPHHIQTAKQWYDIITKSKVKVHEVEKEVVDVAVTPKDDLEEFLA